MGVRVRVDVGWIVPLGVRVSVALGVAEAVAVGGMALGVAVGTGKSNMSPRRSPMSPESPRSRSTSSKIERRNERTGPPESPP
ncbi:MAG TPA: hypothetical protein VJ123_04745 [Anaerolineales bacterium]|nr:hypothetical protein [Anaerolineales bacterium]